MAAGSASIPCGIEPVGRGATQWRPPCVCLRARAAAAGRRPRRYWTVIVRAGLKTTDGQVSLYDADFVNVIGSV